MRGHYYAWECNKPSENLSVLVHCMQDATILLSGQSHMLQAQREYIRKLTLLDNNVSSERRS